MKFSRRRILQAGLGAAQLALLAQFGRSLDGRRARAQNPDAPTRLLTLYVPGGWMPLYLFCPLAAPEITRLLPPRTAGINGSEPRFFDATDVTNLDGSNDALDAQGYARVRAPVLWDAQKLLAGTPDHADQSAGVTSSHGWSWKTHGLHEDTVIVHGVDQGTPSHQSGRISAMSGVAAPSYRSPAVHAWVADTLFDQFSASRPLGCVSIGAAPVPSHIGRRAEAAAIRMPDLGALEKLLSERIDTAWLGLRDRSQKPHVDYAGRLTGETLGTNAIEDFVAGEYRRLHGTTNATTDAFYESLYNTHAEVSRQLALDIVSQLEATPGQEHLPVPFWAPVFNGNAGYWNAKLAPANGATQGGEWQMDLLLKLLKSDICSAISFYMPGLGNHYFDSHDEGHANHFIHLRVVWEQIGRLLGEMKATPLGGGKSLLDDTLVLIISEFARTWPFSGACDHWPYTSVAFVGGGVSGNRMIGNYAVEGMPASSMGPQGADVSLLLEGGTPVLRPPTSADVIHTALRTLGLEEGSFFIPGGSGEILGVRS